jgi:hypothetical protein
MVRRRWLSGYDRDVGLSVDENVFEMHARRPGGSISSGSELSVHAVENVVENGGGGGKRDGEHATAPGQDERRPPSAVFNVLTARAPHVHVDEL